MALSLELAAFGMAVVVSMVNFALPLLAMRLGASPFQLGVVGTVGPLCYTLAAPFTGRLADRLRPKRLMIAGAVIYALVYTGIVWTERVEDLLPPVGLGGAVVALFWPPLAAWIAEGKDREALARALGEYNVAWCTGVVAGPLLGGLAFHVNFRLPFWGAAGLNMAIIALLVGVPGGSGAPTRAEADPPSGVRHPMLYVVWVANFAGYFALGTVRALFPKLGTELGFSPKALGILMALISLAQLATFVHYRTKAGRDVRGLKPLVAAQALAVGGMGLVSISKEAYGFALGFLLLGFLLGTTYSLSLFHSLYGQVQMGAYSGLNEAIVGSGILVGPFVGGWVAQHSGLRAPYVLCALIVAGAVTIEGVLLRHGARNSPKAERP